MIQPVHYLQFEVTFARDELQPGSSPLTHRTSCSTRRSHNMRACGMRHVATPSLQEVIDILATGLLHHRYRRWSNFWLLACYILDLGLSSRQYVSIINRVSKSEHFYSFATRVNIPDLNQYITKPVNVSSIGKWQYPCCVCQFTFQSPHVAVIMWRCYLQENIPFLDF